MQIYNKKFKETANCFFIITYEICFKSLYNKEPR